MTFSAFSFFVVSVIGVYLLDGEVGAQAGVPNVNCTRADNGKNATGDDNVNCRVIGYAKVFNVTRFTCLKVYYRYNRG